MKIIVKFKSGVKQIFIVPKDILATEFRRLAETTGGCIGSIEFTPPSLALRTCCSRAKRNAPVTLFD